MAVQLLVHKFWVMKTQTPVTTMTQRKQRERRKGQSTWGFTLVKASR